MRTPMVYRWPVSLINFLHMVVFSATGLILPLYLLEKGYGPESIGLVLSVLPLIMLVVRTLLSAIGDLIGTRFVLALDGLAMALSAVLYGLATTPASFSIGKIFEGTAHSSYWAVIRTEIYRSAPRNEERLATYMQGLRNIGTFAGQFLAGAVVFYLGFTQAWALLAIVGFVIFLVALRIPSLSAGRVHSFKKLWSMLWTRKPDGFWTVGVLMAFTVLTNAVALAFLFPLYLKTLGFDVLYIGSLLAMFALLAGMAMLVSTRANWRLRTIVVGTILLGAVPYAFLHQLTATTAPLLLGLLAIGEGFSTHLFERIIASVTKRSAQISTDIAVLHFPFRGFEFVALAAMGFVVAVVGFYPVFIGVGLVMFLFALLSTHFLHTKNQKLPL